MKGGVVGNKGKTEAKPIGEEGFNRFHAFSFGVAKAGMDSVNHEKMEKILKQTITNQQYYIT